MSFTIERLDSEDTQEDILIVTGKDVIFKLYLADSIYQSDSSVKKFISFGLCEKENFKKIGQLLSLEDEKVKILNNFLERTEKANNFLKGQTVDTLDRRRKIVQQFESEPLKNMEERLKEISLANNEIASSWGVPNFLAEKKFGFCNGCNFFISDQGIITPLTCPVCGKSLNKTNNRTYHFLREKIVHYLKGNWFPDYLAKGFRSKGWKTWTNLHILGASGIRHEIDLLGINTKTGDTVIGECKTGKISRGDIFTFSVKGQDIHSTFTYFFNISPIPESDTKNL